MNESIIIGLVVGGGVAVIGAFIGHFLRLREMKTQSAEERKRMEALWAEQERTRKSDRRRDLYNRELQIVSDAVEAVIEAMTTRRVCLWGLTVDEKAKWFADWKKVTLMLQRAFMTGILLRDDKLMHKCDELDAKFQRWTELVDLATGDVVPGKVLEITELELGVQTVASEAARRIGEILEEV